MGNYVLKCTVSCFRFRKITAGIVNVKFSLRAVQECCGRFTILNRQLAERYV